MSLTSRVSASEAFYWIRMGNVCDALGVFLRTTALSPGLTHSFGVGTRQRERGERQRRPHPRPLSQRERGEWQRLGRMGPQTSPIWPLPPSLKLWRASRKATRTATESGRMPDPRNNILEARPTGEIKGIVRLAFGPSAGSGRTRQGLREARATGEVRGIVGLESPTHGALFGMPEPRDRNRRLWGS